MEVGTSTTFITNSLGSPKPKDPYEEIATLLEDSILFSGKRAMRFGVIFYGLRVSLIVLSACAAAKGLNFLVAEAPFLSLVVAIGTALDTWLQPGLQYKIHYTYNDRFRALRADLVNVERDDKENRKAITSSWKTLDEEYRKAVFPA